MKRMVLMGIGLMPLLAQSQTCRLPGQFVVHPIHGITLSQCLPEAGQANASRPAEGIPMDALRALLRANPTNRQLITHLVALNLGASRTGGTPEEKARAAVENDTGWFRISADPAFRPHFDYLVKALNDQMGVTQRLAELDRLPTAPRPTPSAVPSPPATAPGARPSTPAASTPANVDGREVAMTPQTWREAVTNNVRVREEVLRNCGTANANTVRGNFRIFRANIRIGSQVETELVTPFQFDAAAPNQFSVQFQNRDDQIVRGVQQLISGRQVRTLKFNQGKWTWISASGTEYPVDRFDEVIRPDVIAWNRPADATGLPPPCEWASVFRGEDASGQPRAARSQQ